MNKYKVQCLIPTQAIILHYLINHYILCANSFWLQFCIRICMYVERRGRNENKNSSYIFYTRDVFMDQENNESYTWRTCKLSVLSASSTRRSRVLQPQCSNFWICLTEPSWVHSASTRTCIKSQKIIKFSGGRKKRTKQDKFRGSYWLPCHSHVLQSHCQTQS